jgi:chromosome segregation ATPase
MTQATDTDIRDLTNLITNLDKKLDKLDSKIDLGFANVTTQITRLDGRIDTLETKIDGRFDTINAKLQTIDINAKTTVDLAEKIGELKNWKQIAIVVFTASVSGAIAWYVRGGNGNL